MKRQHEPTSSELFWLLLIAVYVVCSVLAYFSRI